MIDGAERLAEELRRAGVGKPRLAFVLGSGWSALTDRMEVEVRVPFAELPTMPASRVPGHAGQFAFGTLGGVPVLTQSGRVHLYEGWTPEAVVRSVRAFAQLGVDVVVLTNAAGGLHADWPPGTLMVVTDHVNLQWRRPRTRSTVGASPYSSEQIARLRRAARERSIGCRDGVYAATLGPGYETPAEIRMLRALGADAVGMSTVCEAAAAHDAGLTVAAVSCITNPAAGIADAPLAHEDVVEAGRRASQSFCDLLESFAASSD